MVRISEENRVGFDEANVGKVPPHVAFIEHCERTFAEVFGVAFNGPRTCLSCGARQSLDGELPCGH
ncbi:hypothetical protein WK80_22345 [Burkholderia multivorans]|nr:hypothetical protein WK80_22345 [Burkholderia multivorans]